MHRPASDPLWYKDAVIYELHVRCFFDSNGDGVGDFVGLTRKLGYIQELGVNAIWLLPFYPSPLKDDGYDISDYRGIHPAYGTLRDFRHFVREAHRRGLRVITELVVNHTSDQHSWFQAARRAPPGSARRETYIWSEADDRLAKTRIIFTDTESSNWAWDPVARAYYFHRFFSHQPDLNHNNPAVVRAVIRVLRFWLDMGVDGLRLDAIPYLCVREGTGNENLPETHAVIRQIRAEVDAHYQSRMLLAEANQWPEEVIHYFGQGDECHMAFHFPLMPRIFLALGQADRRPITEIMDQTPPIPATCQWALFLRNHDELTLEMVTDRERDSMYHLYAEDPQMRLNLGIRRRLAPLLGNDRRKIELLNSMLLSFPGTPVIYYGDELGMGDNIYIGDRNGVRTPMQWSGDRNAGFSRADPARLYAPVVMDPVFGYQAVNVEAQLRTPSSLLSWTRGILAVRREQPAFGRGGITFLEPANRRVLAYLREHEGSAVLCVANLAGSAQPVELDLRRFQGKIPLELLGHTPFPRIGELPYLLTLPGYGFYWFSLVSDAEVRFDIQKSVTDHVSLVLPRGWSSLLSGEAHEKLVRQVLPGFLQRQRWFLAKGSHVGPCELLAAEAWAAGGDSWLLALVRVRLGGDGADHEPDGGQLSQLYFLPLALAWGDRADEVLEQWPALVLAKVRRGTQPGVLYDALLDAGFVRQMVQAMARHDTIPLGGGQISLFVTTAGRGLAGQPAQSIRRLQVEQSHTSVVLDEQQILKAFRFIRPGPNQELEMGRFLTEVLPFPNTPPVLGGMELRLQLPEQGRSPEPGQGKEPPHMALALLHRYLPGEGDGWSYTQRYLEEQIEKRLAALAEKEEGTEGEAPRGAEQRAEREAPRGAEQGAEGEVPGGAEQEEHDGYLALARTLGLRTGQLHRTLATPTGDPAFDPEPILPGDLARWRDHVQEDGRRTLALLEQRRGGLPPEVQARVDELLKRQEALQARISASVPEHLDAVQTRFHGDFHLGQVLVTGHDLQIIDFEGEMARPQEACMDKHSPLRDVAGMLRSFNYAAHVAMRQARTSWSGQQELAVRWIRTWEALARQAFLEGYSEGAAGSLALPGDLQIASGLIDLFSLEKALYEINYELFSRPDWVAIPVMGILELLGG